MLKHSDMSNKSYMNTHLHPINCMTVCAVFTPKAINRNGLRCITLADTNVYHWQPNFKKAIRRNGLREGSMYTTF